MLRTVEIKIRNDNKHGGAYIILRPYRPIEIPDFPDQYFSLATWLQQSGFSNSNSEFKGLFGNEYTDISILSDGGRSIINILGGEVNINVPGQKWVSRPIVTNQSMTIVIGDDGFPKFEN